MPIKKFISVLLALMLALTALPAMAAEEASHEITSKEFPFYFDTNYMDFDLPLYFLDGVTDLPYVELSDWAGLLNMLNGDMGYELDLVTNGPIACLTREDDAITATIDFDENTFQFVDYNLFLKFPKMSTLLDFTSVDCVNEDGEPALLKKSDEYSYDRYGDEVVLRLGDYGIDLIFQDDLYLIPLQTMSDFLFETEIGNNVYFNGQALILGGTMSADNEVYYAAPTGKRSEALAKYGYNELCLMLDCMYGLKDAHEITSFAELFDQIGFEPLLLDPDPEIADRAVYYFINKYLDDIHSSFRAYSYLTGPIDYKAERGPSLASLVEHNRTYTQARSAQYPDGIPAYEEVGNTAYITFDKFALTSTNLDDYYDIESIEELPFDGSDTVALIIRAHKEINRENSPIENVVIDLSCNTGGMVDVAAYVIAWCLGKASISLKDSFTGAMSNTDYWADVNLDREFDEKDTIADKNIYCLISPISFSCGNLVPNVFKQSGKVTLLGRTSGGGSCVVLYAATAWGTAFNLSSSRRMSFLKNGSLYDIDRGADPDYTISKPEKYYDRQALTDYINTLY